VVVGSYLVEGIRLSLDAGAATSATIATVTGLVETLARSVRAVAKRR
jgi:hypothetical protein